MSVLLYCHGVSLNAIAGRYKVRTSSVLRWVREFAKQHYPEAGTERQDDNDGVGRDVAFPGKSTKALDNAILRII